MQQCRDWAIFLARVYFANCCAILTCITTCKVMHSRQYKYQTNMVGCGCNNLSEPFHPVFVTDIKSHTS
jgi:hypothetical protein